MVEMADRLVARAVAPLVSEFYRQAHERRGTPVLLSTGVAAFERRRRPGRPVSCSRTAACCPPTSSSSASGVLPRTELAEQLGLACDGGIVVDAHARTSAPGVVAAGDCTVLPHPLTGVGRVRLESVQNAVAQATVAAGDPARGRSRPSARCRGSGPSRATCKLQIAGLATGWDRHVLRGDPDSERFSVLYYRGGELLAVDAVNSPVDYMVVRKALGSGATLPAERPANAATPLKQLLGRELPARDGCRCRSDDGRLQRLGGEQLLRRHCRRERPCSAW